MDSQKIEHAVLEFIKAIGEDPNREGLQDTPKRVARMCEEIFCGNYINPEKDIKVFQEETVFEKNWVIVKDIPVYSVCEHHLMPFFGKVKIGYIPHKGNIIGLSKIVRVVNDFARRLQVQERLTNNIADLLFSEIKTEAVVVLIEAEHLCMTMRGVKSQGSKTQTLAIRQKDDFATDKIEILKALIAAK